MSKKAVFSQRARPVSRVTLLGVLVLLAGLLVGCQVAVKPAQTQVSEYAVLNPSQPAGQSFLARYAGLQGVELYLQPEQPGEGQVTLRLYPSALEETPIAESQLSVSAVRQAGYYRFEFPIQSDSTNQSYFISLELTGSGSLLVGAAPGERYSQGSRYQGTTPVDDGQLAFQLAYAAGQRWLGLAKEGLTWGLYLLAAAWLFGLPGWVLLELLWPAPQQPAIVRLALAGAFGLALYALLFLLFDLLGLSLGRLYAWLPSLLALAWLVWRARPSAGQWKATRLRLAWPGWANLTLGLLLVLLFGLRFWVVRNQAAPLWGDALQHAVIVQRMLEQGGLFTSWQPYAPIPTFSYHYGFHSATTVFAWLSGLPAEQAVTWFGQILNGMAVISLYPLAQKIGRSRWSGLVALVVAGFLAPVPMSYTNWGRFPQLAGQVLLPVVAYLTWELLRSPQPTRPNWRLALLTGLAWAGLGLSHYRILIFGLMFLPAALLLLLRRTSWKAQVSNLLISGLSGGLFFLPWFLNAFGSRMLALFTVQITRAAAETPAQVIDPIRALDQHLPEYLWLSLPLLIGYGLWRRERGAALVSLWWFLILLAANPQWLGLPGAGALTNFAVLIAAYLPAAILIGGLLPGLARETALGLRLPVRRLWPLAASAGLLVVALLGADLRRSDIRADDYALVTHPDRQAFAWIATNTSPEARFLVNSFRAFVNARVGSDAGWWLPLLAGRDNSVPPLNYASEREPWPGYRQSLHAIPDTLAAGGPDSQELLALLDEQGLTHVYIGQQQGRVNYAGPTLNPADFEASPHYELIYHQDRVWIFARQP